MKALSLLEKYREELTSKKMEYREEYDLLSSRIRENEKFLQLISTKENVYFTGFSPREQDIKNKNKQEEVKQLLTDLNQKRKALQIKIDDLNSRLFELEAAHLELDKLDKIDSKSELKLDDSSETDSKLFYNNDELSFQLNTICSYILSDPRRAKIELEYLLDCIKKN